MHFARKTALPRRNIETLSRFVGRQRLDRQRVDIALHQIVDRRVNQPMPGHRGYAAKRLRDDTNSKMALPAGRPGMALVQMALILDRQLRRRKAALATARASAARVRAGGVCGSRPWPGQPEYLRKHEEHGRRGKSKDLEFDPQPDSKVLATYRFRMAKAANHAAHSKLISSQARAETANGSGNAASSKRRTSGCLPTTKLPRNTAEVRPAIP